MVNFPSKLRISLLPIAVALEIKRINNTTIISGFEAELIKLLSQKLNFEFDILIPPDSAYGLRDEFGNWTGMVRMLAHNETDLAFSLMGVTEDRFTAVDFSLPYLPFEKTFLMNRASFLPKTSVFTYPFSTLVWFYFFVVLLLVTVIFRALIAPKDSMCSVFINFCGSCFRQAMKYNPHLMTRRIPLGIWLIYSYVITLSYSSVLLSFLSAPIRMKQIKDFKELYTAVKEGKMECRAALHSLEADHLLKSDLPHLKGLGEYIKKNEWYYTMTTSQMVPENSAMLGSPLLFRILFGPPKTYFYSKDIFGNFRSGIAMRKDFCCKERFNAMLLRILSAGLYNKFMNDDFFKLDLKQKLNNDNAKNSISALTLSDLNGLFIAFGVGCVTAVLVLIFEIVFSRCFDSSFSKRNQYTRSRSTFSKCLYAT